LNGSKTFIKGDYDGLDVKLDWRKYINTFRILLDKHFVRRLKNKIKMDVRKIYSVGGGQLVSSGVLLSQWNFRLAQPDFLFSFLGWGETAHLVRRPLIGLLYQPRMIDDECGAVGGMRIGRGKPKYSEKTCPSATLSTRNPA
jgi:hypothetical protein